MASRVATKSIPFPKGSEVKVDAQLLTIKGQLGQQQFRVSDEVKIHLSDSEIQFEPASAEDVAITGTTRAIVNNLLAGVSKGFEAKLELVGVGYRAQAKGKTLDLTLGFSHPVAITMPEGLNVETPSQTEILIKGVDKQQVFQMAANIRSLRPPEPYKGKGVRYAGEQISLKEGKKK